MCKHLWSDNPLLRHQFCLKCFAQKPEGIPIPYNDTALNRLAQYVYEEINDSPDMHLSIRMSSKLELVEALRRAMERVEKA